MTPEQRALVDEAVQAAAAKPLAEQIRIVQERAAGDKTVYQEVISLLRGMAELGDEGLFDIMLQARPDAKVEANNEEHSTPEHRPANDDSAKLHQPQVGNAFGIGSQIGPYKILSELGQGGFGTVYLAEQTEPIRRRVALKLIKPGMDTQAVLARFEQERQALGIMDHSGIARVFTSGMTELGRPYFVMEYIPGEPITRHCDKNCLTVDERVELFLSVCDAVAHAHEKGVVHRDLKPSNVLVAYQAGHPVVKIIDFGIAKALSQPLVESPDQTVLGQAIGTPEYMSPEQAEIDRQSIDQRADVYSLGAMLYELLCGMPPFDSGTLRAGGLEQMREMLRTVPPPPPSERLRRLSRVRDKAEPAAADTKPAPSALEKIARNRKLTPRRLSKLLCGEPDAIVMKCLEKRRERRYPHVSDLARDLRMYLEGHTVEYVGGPKPAQTATGWRGWKPVTLCVGTALVLMIGALWMRSPGADVDEIATASADDAAVVITQRNEPSTSPAAEGETAGPIRALLPLETMTINESGPADPVIVSGWVVNEQELERVRRRLAGQDAAIVLEVEADADEVRRRLRRALETAGASGLRVVSRQRPDWGPHYIQVWFTPTEAFTLQNARDIGRRYVLDEANLVITELAD